MICSKLLHDENILEIYCDLDPPRLFDNTVYIRTWIISIFFTNYFINGTDISILNTNYIIQTIPAVMIPFHVHL